MESNYRKRTQKDYPMSLKLQVVQEIESGQLSQKGAHLTGRIKYQHLCQRHQNKGLWSSKQLLP